MPYPYGGKAWFFYHLFQVFFRRETKMKYEKPEMGIVLFDEKDVITSSTLINGGTGSDQEIDFSEGFK